MKKLMMVFCSMFAFAALAQEMTLAEANAQIDKAIADPTLVTKIVKMLPTECQTNFLASINKAIEGLPGNAASKTETFLEVNRAALKGAQASGNVAPMLAEVYATVPVGVLPAISQSFAADLFNRAADPSVTYTDAQYEAIAKNLMNIVNSRTASADDGAARSAFAAEMIAQAANGASDSLANALADSLPGDLGNKAKNDGWFKGDANNADAILAAAGAEAAPGVNTSGAGLAGGEGAGAGAGGAGAGGAGAGDNGIGSNLGSLARPAGPTVLDSLLADLVGGNDPSAPGGSFVDNANAPGNAAEPILGGGGDIIVPSPDRPVDDAQGTGPVEPRGYQWQD